MINFQFTKQSSEDYSQFISVHNQTQDQHIRISNCDFSTIMGTNSVVLQTDLKSGFIELMASRYSKGINFVVVKSKKSKVKINQCILNRLSISKDHSFDGYLHLQDSNLTILESSFKDNFGSNFGGVLYYSVDPLNSESPFLLFSIDNKTQFFNNSAELGGAIYYSFKKQYLLFKKANFQNNKNKYQETSHI